LPEVSEVIPALRDAAAAASAIKLREPRPAGFPLLFSADLELMEPALDYLHEHSIRRAHTAETLRTYLEILYDWLDALEQSGISWWQADAIDLIAYRNRMLNEPSMHTGRPYSVHTINHRVHGVLRFYEWMVRNGRLETSDLIGHGSDFAVTRQFSPSRHRHRGENDRRLFVLRQFESLPRPLTSAQARELLAHLTPPYDLMARWQLYTGLRVSELLRLTVGDVSKRIDSQPSTDSPVHLVIDVMRKGRKRGYVIASASLIEETDVYRHQHRQASCKRAARKERASARDALFINSRGSAVKKNSYQKIVRAAGEACGYRATTHLLRATFACMMLARLEQLAKRGAAINPLLVTKILMGHEHIETTDRYLRAVAIDTHSVRSIPPRRERAMAQRPRVDRTGTPTARLAHALDVLTHRQPSGSEPYRATVAELCRIAGVSRNSLYRYHTGILKTLRKIQSRRVARKDFDDGRIRQPLRTENARLRGQMIKLVALVDHYYAAYRETAALLARRELAELRCKLHLKPALLTAAV
jgi:integrase